VTLLDERLDINLFKPSPPALWDFIQVFSLTKDQLKTRREASLAQYYAREEEKLKLAKDVKLAQDKHSIDQQMKIEGYQRKQIKAKKEEEKKQTETELFRDLEEMEHRNQLLLEQKMAGENKRKQIVDKVEKEVNEKQVIQGKAISAT